MSRAVIVPWEPDLVEAYARQGRAGDARRVLARLERLADRTGSLVTRAARRGARGTDAADRRNPLTRHTLRVTPPSTRMIAPVV
jgi:hypothetical protein